MLIGFNLPLSGVLCITEKLKFAESEMGQNEKSAFFGLMSASSSCGY